MVSVGGVRFEHYDEPFTLGVDETVPRISWKIQHASPEFKQVAYEMKIFEENHHSYKNLLYSAKTTSASSTLVPWPLDDPLRSRQSVLVQVRVFDAEGHTSSWSEPARLEAGLLDRADWICHRIAAPWESVSAPESEKLFRKEFALKGIAVKARLYVTSQGVYEASINGQKVGDYFLAPGWTSYEGRIQYQTYDVTSMLNATNNCLGVRVAEGWFSGRIGFEGGHRNIWGSRNTLLAQLEIIFANGQKQTVCSDDTWFVSEGPIQLAELYDGEKYDATQEISGWSCSYTNGAELTGTWKPIICLPRLPETTKLTAGYGGPTRRIETIKPAVRVISPSGKTIIDFGQNLVGYVKLKDIKGGRGSKITLTHAEVLEHGELCTRPLRDCKAEEEYTLKGSENEEGEAYEPRFTFHGFRYVQINGWQDELDMASVEAVVCHTQMKSAGTFSCSEPLLNKLYQNIVWGVRGNFLSIPTDCPQRDERLGWTGDLALFVPTAVLIYDCFGIIKNWLIDLEYDQGVLDGVPPMFSPNSALPDPVWCRRVPCAIWHDATIIVPWNLYLETGDTSILAQQYNSMMTWIRVIPKNKEGATHLWSNDVFQLGDWLDPTAPPNAPWKSPTDAKMVANMFLVQSLDLMIQISRILGMDSETSSFETEAKAARIEFHDEYVTPNGRMVSDTQATYALAICLDILTSKQRVRAGKRLVELVRKNNFKIATGFAGTPFLCEALAATGHTQIAYALLLETGCPSWLYPVTMGATTVWERWDSMLPNGEINPGEMTSFNHYAFGAIAKFMYERIAGLQRLEPGWTKCRIAPAIGATISKASAEHVTPYGTISCIWETTSVERPDEIFEIKVTVPYGIIVEIVMPQGKEEIVETVGHGDWSFRSSFQRDYEWPVLPLKPKS